jgi:uncharacterized membrane protein
VAVSPALKRLSWALALSLGLNVFLLGFSASRFARGGREHMHEGPPRGAMRRVLGEPTPELMAHRGDLREARRAVAEALETEPLDRARLKSALDRLRTETSEGQAALHERLLERASELPIEQRRELAQSRLLRGKPSPP